MKTAAILVPILVAAAAAVVFLVAIQEPAHGPATFRAVQSDAAALRASESAEFARQEKEQRIQLWKPLRDADLKALSAEAGQLHRQYLEEVSAKGDSLVIKEAYDKQKDRLAAREAAVEAEYQRRINPD